MGSIAGRGQTALVGVRAAPRGGASELARFSPASTSPSKGPSGDPFFAGLPAALLLEALTLVPPQTGSSSCCTSSLRDGPFTAVSAHVRARGG